MDAADMLFGADVNDYLKDVDQTVREFWASSRRMGIASQKGDMEAIQRNYELTSRLSETLLPRRREVFRPYLSI